MIVNYATHFPKGGKLANEYFTGNTFLTPLIAKENSNNFVIGNITSQPSARTIWHTHPKGQGLIVTEGNGLYLEKGKEAQAFKRAM